MTDSNGGTDTATVTLTITGVNDAPTAVADGYGTDEETAINIAAGAGMVSNDTDPDTSDVLTVQSIDTTGTLGTVIVNADGSFSYDPNGQFEALAVGETALDTFSYTVTDSNGGSDTATVTLTITGVNDAPTATADAYGTDEDTVLNVAAGTGLVSNDTDPDASDVLTVQSVDTTGTLGTVTMNADGSFSYDPNGQFESLAVGETALDTFSYTVTDSNGGTDTATVTLTITGVNDAPTAVADGYGTDEATAINVAAGTGLVSNDTDPDTSDVLTVQSIDTTGTLGTVTVNPDGSFSYDPNGQFESLADGETSLDTFSYTVTDSNGGTDTGTVTITITGSNDVPVVNDQNLGFLDENSPIGTVVGTVAASDVDASQSLSYGITGGNTGGAFAIDSGTG